MTATTATATATAITATTDPTPIHLKALMNTTKLRGCFYLVSTAAAVHKAVRNNSFLATVISY